MLAAVIDMLITEALVAERTERRISQRELARRLGKPPSFVNKIELFERRLDLLEFIAIAKAINIEPQQLMTTILSRLPDKVIL